jgi:hypothetical protein
MNHRNRAKIAPKKRRNEREANGKNAVFDFYSLKGAGVEK